MVPPLVVVRALARQVRAPITIVSAVALLSALALSAWRPQAQKPPDRSPNAVRVLDPSAPAPRANPSDRGATYHWLEGRALRTTTRFPDATVVTDRVPGGDLKTRVLDAGGNEIATLTVDRVQSGSDVLDFRGIDDTRVRALGRAGATPTLDWSNRQAYALWKDTPAGGGAALEWQDDLMRRRGAGIRDIGAEAIEIGTEWPEGFAAVATRSAGVRRHAVTGALVRGRSLESVIKRDNLEVGRSRWYPEEQVYVWSFPGLTKGYLDADRMKDLGGWTFTPDLAWTNVQNFAFHYFHTLVATQGFVADRAPARPGWLARLTTAIAPVLHANEAGCDNLHWMDGSLYRPCCDAHDLCYEKWGCTWKSWWEWWSSWKCTGCNMAVVICITTAYPPFSPSYP